MCDCIAKLQDPATWKSPDGGKPEKVSLDLAIADINGTMEAVTCSRMEVTMPGKKRVIVQSVAHSHCPWCGAKYGSDPNVVPLVRKMEIPT